MVFFLPEQFQIFLVIFMSKDATVGIFQVDGTKATTLSNKVKCILEWL